MNKHLRARDDFSRDRIADCVAAQGASADGEALVVALDGYEGPLDVLLALARAQRVDLRKLSVSELADQYLAFVREARARSFALAADYLVMAAWLAFLKSRLLLPRDEEAGPESLSAQEAARRLAHRLARLDAMRRAGEALAARPALGRDVFARGDPQAVQVIRRRPLEGDLYELMAAYVGQRREARRRHWRPRPAVAYRLDEARERLTGLLPGLVDWTALEKVIPDVDADGEGPSRASLLASTLSASLELVRERRLAARQIAHFSPVWLRAHGAGT